MPQSSQRAQAYQQRHKREEISFRQKSCRDIASQPSAGQSLPCSQANGLRPLMTSIQRTQGRTKASATSFVAKAAPRKPPASAIYAGSRRQVDLTPVCAAAYSATAAIKQGTTRVRPEKNNRPAAMR